MKGLIFFGTNSIAERVAENRVLLSFGRAEWR